MTEKNLETTPAPETGDEELARLDREAREALDRLADRREQLERRHEATALAAERAQKREEERRRREAEEAQRKAEEAARLRREEIAEETRALEDERDELAGRIVAIIERLRELDSRMVEEASLYDTERANALISSQRGRHRSWLKRTFGGV